MKTFKQIISKLKQITHTDKDKDIAAALNIKPAALASLKHRDKPPFKAILTYCHENRLDVRKVLFNEAEPIISFPIPLEDGKVRVKYFRSLDIYSHYLGMK